MSFSPDGKYLAVAGGTPSLFGELQIWSVADGKLMHSVSMSHDTLFGVTFNADSTLVAFGGADNRVRALDVASGKSCDADGCSQRLGFWVQHFPSRTIICSASAVTDP